MSNFSCSFCLPSSATPQTRHACAATTCDSSAECLAKDKLTVRIDKELRHFEHCGAPFYLHQLEKRTNAGAAEVKRG